MSTENPVEGEHKVRIEQCACPYCTPWPHELRSWTVTCSCRWEDLDADGFKGAWISARLHLLDMMSLANTTHEGALMTGTRVTCEDLDTGESESAVIEDSFTDGYCYVDGVRHVIAIKTKKD